ncbi:hypothetical protein ACROYT_G014818 [Oculina patagonica]
MTTIAELLSPGPLKVRESEEDPRFHGEELWKVSVKTWAGLAGMRWNSEEKTVKDGGRFWVALCSSQRSKEDEVNVPCVSTQTQNKNLHKSPLNSKQEIQMEAIKELSKCNPKGHYYIKGDGTDVKARLQESMRKVWNGDVDLLDGKLQNLMTEYDTWISTSQTITTCYDIRWMTL